MKRIINKLKFKNIDALVYRRTRLREIDLPNFNYKIESKRKKSKFFYFIKIDGKKIHKSTLFKKVFLLDVINKKGPAIGDCFTDSKYRGQSIYPYVINVITNDALQAGSKEVFIIVDKDNQSSINGIEKAHFIKFASIKAQRWLCFYRNKKIQFFNS